jgi:glutathione S-transferase
MVSDLSTRPTSQVNITNARRDTYRKVAMVLEELSLPYEIHYLELSEVKNESYLEVTPNGRLPALTDPNTGITLWEVCNCLTTIL